MSSVVCITGADCSGFNGECVDGACVCHRGWRGSACGEVAWTAQGAFRAFNATLWSWGGSLIRDPADGVIHMFASELSDNCGILHYCSNSRIIHLTAKEPLGPYQRQGVALGPSRPPLWDAGAVHGPTIHRLPPTHRSNPKEIYALFYMGTANTWDPHNGSHPNCSVTVDPNQGDRASRRIGVATAVSPWGPWERREQPIFGPGDALAGDWDFTDVSNPTPIFMSNGSTVLLYKGRGHVQAMGAARAPSFAGPFVRLRPSTPILSGVEDTWGWVQPASANHPEILHVLDHAGNGANSAGGHAWSLDGVTWTDTTVKAGGAPAYTGRIRWSNGTETVMLRRERPQVLLRATPSAAVTDSYGEPAVICTSVQPLSCPKDGGPPETTDACRSFTVCEEVE